MTFEAKLIAEYLHGLVAIANDHHFIDVPKSLLCSDTPWYERVYIVSCVFPTSLSEARSSESTFSS